MTKKSGSGIQEYSRWRRRLAGESEIRGDSGTGASERRGRPDWEGQKFAPVTSEVTAVTVCC